MPYRYAIDPDRDLLVVRGWDTLALDEVQEGALDTLSDPAFRPGLRILVDYTRLRRYDLPLQDVRRLADFLHRHRDAIGAARIAMVAPADAVYGVGRMWSSLQPEWAAEVAFFRTLEEGAAWLDVTPDTLPTDAPSPGSPST